MLFKNFDFNKSGTLEQDEVTVMMSTYLQILLKVINDTKMPSIFEIEKKSKEMFTNSKIQGQITVQELKKFVRQDNQISKILQILGKCQNQIDEGEDTWNPEYDPELELECNPKIDHGNQPTRLKMTDMDISTNKSQTPKYGTLLYCVSDLQQEQNSCELPAGDLTLNHVYGYRCQDTRNNLRYTQDGKVVYHTACVGIVLDPRTNKQKFFIGHTEQIKCLSVCKQRCATGQIGPNPLLCVWNLDTMELICKTNTQFTGGIVHCTFSQNGKFIAASDINFNIAIYYASQLRLVATTQCSKQPILSLQFNSTNDALVITSLKHVVFADWNEGKINLQAASDAGINKNCGAALSSAFVGNTLCTGTQRGNILTWDGNICVNQYKAHEGKINCLWASAKFNQLISCGLDGQVKVWQMIHSQLTLINTLNITTRNRSAIISVCDNSLGFKLFGTRNGEIIEYSEQDKTQTSLMCSHQEITAMATHQTRAEIFTLDASGTLIQWNLRDKKFIAEQQLSESGDAMAASKNGKYLAVGFKSGAFFILQDNCTDLKAFKKRNDRQNSSISCISFSPNDDVLAVAGQDNLVLTYDVLNNFMPLKKLSSGFKVIKSLDFTVNGRIIRCGGDDHEQVFWYLDSDQKVHNRKDYLKNERWASHTCFDTEQLKGVELSEITAIELCPDEKTVVIADQFGVIRLQKYPTHDGNSKKYTHHSGQIRKLSLSKYGKQDMLSISGQDLFQWAYTFEGKPCVAETIDLANFKQEDKYIDQESFDIENQQLPQQSVANTQEIINRLSEKQINTEPLQATQQINQMALIQKQSVTKEEKNDPVQIFQNKQQEKIKQFENQILLEKKSDSNQHKAGAKRNEKPIISDDFGVEEELEGDEALMVKAWKPIEQTQPDEFKTLPKDQNQIPDQSLVLKWAHGYRTWDTNRTLRYQKDQKEIIYITAGLGVVQNINQRTQKFFNEHHNDVVAMAYHKQLDLVATGQMADLELNESSQKVGAKSKEGKLVEILIWKASTCQLVNKCEPGPRRSVKCLCFSPDGSKLLAVGSDDHMTAFVFKVGDGKLLGSSTTEGAWSVAWNNETEFAAFGGDKGFRYNLDKGQISQMRCNILTGQAKQKLISVVQFISNTLYTGSIEGEITTWSGTSPAKDVKAHQTAVSVIEVSEDKTFWTGGNDGLLIQWSHPTQKMITVDLNKISNLGLLRTGVHSVDFKNDGQTILIATQSADVFEINTKTNVSNHLVHGHFRGVQKNAKNYPEIWGCATHPLKQCFASCGGDRTVRVWDAKQQIIRSEQLRYDPTVIDWSPNGSFIAVGDRYGFITVLDGQHLKKVQEPLQSNQGGKPGNFIQALKFSPCGTMVAFGVHGSGNSQIQIASIDVAGRLKLHTFKNFEIISSLIGLDWTSDSLGIAVNGAGYDVRWFSITKQGDSFKAAQVNARDTKNWQYQSLTRKFDWCTMGIWEKGIEGSNYTDIVSVCRSNHQKIIATGDHFSKVKIYKYPCNKDRSRFKEFYGHASFVTNLKFSKNDKYLISTGGIDLSVLVWEVQDSQIKQEADEVFVSFIHQDKAKEKQFQTNQSTKLPQLVPKVNGQPLKPGEYLTRPQTSSSKGSQKQDVNALLKQYGGGDISVQQAFRMLTNTKSKDQNTKLKSNYVASRMPLTLMCKPWVGQIQPPKYWKRTPRDQHLAPQVKLDLDWVYGYRSDVCVNSIRYMNEDDGEGPRLAYFAAAVGIVYNTQKNNESTTGTQRYFRNTNPDGYSYISNQQQANGHIDDISAIAFHPNGDLVATGEQGRWPACYIWNQRTMKMTAKLIGNGIVRNISCLAFSPDGNRLVIIDQSKEHNIAVYQLSKLPQSQDFDSAGRLADPGLNVLIWQCVARTSYQSDIESVQEVGWKDGSDFYTVGPLHFRLWSVVTQTSKSNNQSKAQTFGYITGRTGNFKQMGPKFHSGCVINDDGRCLTGSVTGQLYVWTGTVLTQTIKCHDGPDQTMLKLLTKEKILSLGSGLEAICLCEDYILTGGRDKNICVLDKKNYQRLFCIDLKNNESVRKITDQIINNRIRAITVNKLRTKLAIGYFSSEIVELDVDFQNLAKPLSSTLVTSGHYAPNYGFDNEVWGLSCYDKYAATCGHDGVIRVWDLIVKKQFSYKRLDLNDDGSEYKELKVNQTYYKKMHVKQEFAVTAEPKERWESYQKNRRIKIIKSDISFAHQASSIAFSYGQDVQYLAVGLMDGSIRVLSWPDLKTVFQARYSNEQSQDLKFSPDGKFLLVSSHDCDLYLFDVENWKLIRSFGKSTSYVTHVDWSSDSTVIRTNDASYEILYYDVLTGKHDPDGSRNYKDKEWFTHNCVISWETQGIWQSGQNGTDIDSCDVSKFPTNNQQVIASGDDFGHVSIFRYPSLDEASEPVIGKGHSSHVTKVEFSKNQSQFLVSTGGKDLSVMQWTVKQL